jgi:hypothetical protein
MNEIERNTCIRFVPRSNQPDFIDIFNGNGQLGFFTFLSSINYLFLSLSILIEKAVGVMLDGTAVFKSCHWVIRIVGLV